MAGKHLAGAVLLGVLATLAGVAAFGFLVAAQEDPLDQVQFLPVVFGEAPPPPPDRCERTWDPRLDELGVTLERAPAGQDEPFWCLIEARWADPDEAAGRHDIFMDALDAGGQRLLGQQIIVEWATGSGVVVIEDKPPPEYGASFPMYGTLGSYAAHAGGAMPSDRIAGMGLGTAEHPDVPSHTCFYLTFQWIP